MIKKIIFSLFFFSFVFYNQSFCVRPGTQPKSTLSKSFSQAVEDIKNLNEDSTGVQVEAAVDELNALLNMPAISKSSGTVILKKFKEISDKLATLVDGAIQKGKGWENINFVENSLDKVLNETKVKTLPGFQAPETMYVAAKEIFEIIKTDSWQDFLQKIANENSEYYKNYNPINVDVYDLIKADTDFQKKIKDINIFVNNDLSFNLDALKKETVEILKDPNLAQVYKKLFDDLLVCNNKFKEAEFESLLSDNNIKKFEALLDYHEFLNNPTKESFEKYAKILSEEVSDPEVVKVIMPVITKIYESLIALKPEDRIVNGRNLGSLLLNILSEINKNIGVLAYDQQAMLIRYIDKLGGIVVKKSDLRSDVKSAKTKLSEDEQRVIRRLMAKSHPDKFAGRVELFKSLNQLKMGNSIKDGDLKLILQKLDVSAEGSKLLDELNKRIKQNEGREKSGSRMVEEKKTAPAEKTIQEKAKDLETEYNSFLTEDVKKSLGDAADYFDTIVFDLQDIKDKKYLLNKYAAINHYTEAKEKVDDLLDDNAKKAEALELLAKFKAILDKLEE